MASGFEDACVYQIVLVPLLGFQVLVCFWFGSGFVRLCTWFAGLFIIRVGVFCVVGVWPFVCEDLCFGFGPWCLWSLDPWALSLFNVQVSGFLAYWMWGALGLLA